MLEHHVPERAEGAMRHRCAELAGHQRGRTLPRNARQRQQLVLGGGVNERALVEPVVEARLQEAGAGIVAQPPEVPLDLTVLPMVVVGARGE